MSFPLELRTALERLIHRLSIVASSFSSAALPPPEFFDPDRQEVADASPASTLPEGFALGPYVVRSCIGRGAMAAVYRAEHTVLKKHFALKIMSPALLDSSEARQRFLLEAQAAAAIDHPNVVHITDAGVAAGTPYLVMELLEGEDLERYLDRSGPLSVTEVAALGLPLAAALAAAHEHGVVHRDVKPGNVFLAQGPEGQCVPKLLDFGISKLLRSATPAELSVTGIDELMGSPLYLPPEAMLGARELTPRSDQYSLAVVLYECVTGQPPFVRDGLLPLLNAITAGEFVEPRRIRPEIPVALERAIVRAMSTDPARRYEHMREFGRALLEVADARSRATWGAVFGGDADPALAPPAAELAPSVGSSPPRRRRSLTFVGLGLVMMTATWLALGGARRSGEAPPPVEAQARSGYAATPTAGRAAAEVDVPALAAPAVLSPSAPVVRAEQQASGAKSNAAKPNVARRVTKASAAKQNAAASARATHVGKVGSPDGVVPAGRDAKRSAPNRAAPARAASAKGRAPTPDDSLDAFFRTPGAPPSATAAEGRAPQGESAPVVVNEAPFFD